MASLFIFHSISILQIQSRRNLQLYTKTYTLNFTRGFVLSRNYYRKSDINDCDQNKVNKSISANQFQLNNIPFHLQELQPKNDSKSYTEFSLPRSNKTKLKNMLNSIIELVEEITHMDEARKAYAKVMDIKDKLKETGNHKRQILTDLNRIRDEIQKLHADMRLVNRGSEHHIQLLDYELDCLKRERQKQDEFRAIDQVESNLFNELTAAINDSHEKEKIHANSIRMWGYVQAVIAAFLTFCISVLGYFYHNTKFGLLATKFENSVNTTVKFEIGSLKKDMTTQIQELEEKLLKKYENREAIKNNQESWGSYFKRHGTSIYRFFWPKRQ